MTNKNPVVAKTQNQEFKVKLDTISLFDSSRNRNIPVAIFSPKTDNQIKNQKVVFYSHGYRQNRQGSYLTHSILANLLASKGYFVVSIQHENPTDSLIPAEGIPKIVRRTNWERGATNILFVLNEFKRTNPHLDYNHVTLIGYSNGGDMSMLFAQKYPNLLYKIISLDNRRFDFPRASTPKVYSLRSSDQVADEGVIPTLEEQKSTG
ncbi:MAG: alpha/beta hydrolase [Chitinophagaceae bacterium]|nr:alpha/beta hydrolase [Chitinophagaceae bacterium]